MNELRFSRNNNEKYDTISFTIEGGLLTLMENYTILKIDKTKWDYKKVVIQLDDPDLLERIKQWETRINDYLKSECIEPITFLYGNKIYPKTLLNNTKKTKNDNYIKLKGIWVNNENKPFLQYWLE